MAKNQGNFDGLPVEMYDGKFSGTFELNHFDGEGVAVDDVVSFLVVGTVSKVAIDVTKTGDLKRTNTFAVGNVNLLSNELAYKFAKQIGEGNQVSVSDDWLNEVRSSKESEPEFDLGLNEEEEELIVFSPDDLVAENTARHMELAPAPQPVDMNDFLYGVD